MPTELHPENLILINELPPERQREIRSMGGKASQAARKRRKAMREQLEMILSTRIKDEELKEQLEKFGIKKGDMVYQTAMLVSMVNKSISDGDVKATEFIRDTLGENPNKVVVMPNEMNATIEETMRKLEERPNGFDTIENNE